MSASARVTIEQAGSEEVALTKRRRYSIAEKRRIVEESFQPKTSVARVARAHGINANQVFSWRRLYQRGRLGEAVQAVQNAELLPVTVAEGSRPVSVPAALPVGTIQLQLPRARLRIEGVVDPGSLRLVLECLLA